MRDEGVTKYTCRFQTTHAPAHPALAELIACRDRLFGRQLIGVYPDGIGYGNISLRPAGWQRFFITGTQTGDKPALSTGDIALVTAYNIAENVVECEGLVPASSESMTHAAVYELSPEIGAVIHVHHSRLWHRAAGHLPTTGPGIAYGTPAMAREMRRLCDEANLLSRRLLVMAGHEEGVIAFGAGLAEAEAILNRALIDFTK
ncbi:MAG: hypothetical protein OHK0011_11010 [Turneriella sp.]